MTKRIFITGASGFIGSNLAKRLVSDGNEVVALLRRDSIHPSLKGIPIKKIYGDITDRASIENGVQGCNYIYHCAAKISFNKRNYSELYRINVLGTKNVLDIALKYGIEKFIHISACAVFGYSKAKETIDEDSKYNVPYSNVYAYTKKLSEDEAKEYYLKGLNVVVANPCTVYGQGDIRLNSGSFIKAIYNNKLKLAPPGGTSVVSVDDVVNGLILMLNNGHAGENYIFADENIEYIDLANRIANIVGAEEVRHKIAKCLYYPAVGLAAAIEFINRNSTLITSQIAREFFGYKYYNSSKARRELGWKPMAGLEDAIRKAFEFYRTHGLL